MAEHDLIDDAAFDAQPGAKKAAGTAIVVGGRRLTIEDVVAIAERRAPVAQTFLERQGGAPYGAAPAAAVPPPPPF